MKSFLSSLFILICVLNTYSGTASCMPFLFTTNCLSSNNTSVLEIMASSDVLPQHFYNGSFSQSRETVYSINSCSFDCSQFCFNLDMYTASDIPSISDICYTSSINLEKLSPNFSKNDFLIMECNVFKLAKSDFNWIIVPFDDGLVTLSFNELYSSKTPKQEYKTNKIINHFFNKTTITHVSLNYW